MDSLSTLIHEGSGNMWVFIPTAILLGALHGLEPGHSKTMIAAFIVAVRGTVAQAALLGISATVSHTAVVWAVALAGIYFGQKSYSPSSEPFFHIASGVIVIAIALWMIVRLYRQQRYERAHKHAHEHGHEHTHDLPGTGWADAHERAHARDIERHYDKQNVTNRQIILFGLTGGLIPCPAAITVLLVCLQLKKFALGISLVLCFSVGLAVTMVATGAIAALSVRHANRRWPHIGEYAQKAPYLSGALILLLGGYMIWDGIAAIG